MLGDLDCIWGMSDFKNLSCSETLPACAFSNSTFPRCHCGYFLRHDTASPELHGTRRCSFHRLSCPHNTWGQLYVENQWHSRHRWWWCLFFFCQLFVYIHFIISLKTLLIDSLTFTDSSVNSWLTNCEISPVRQNIWPTFTLEALYGSPTGPCIHTFYVLRFPEITGWFSLDLEITKLCFPEITIKLIWDLE